MRRWEEMPELLPPQGSPDVGDRVFSILSQVIGDKINKGLHEKWLEYYKVSRNQFWKRQSTSVPLVSVNLLHTHRIRTQNILTDNNPTFNLVQLGRGGGDEKDTYSKLQRSCEYWWNEQEQQAVFERSVMNGEMYGPAIEKVFFNPTLEYGTGEVETVIVDPFYFGFWPVNCLDIQKAEAVFYFYPMSLREARRRWPHAANEIKSDDEWLKELGTERSEVVSGGTGGSSSSIWIRIAGFVKSMVTDGAASSFAEDAHKTLVCECWAKDYTTDKKTGEPLYAGNIRCVTACSGGKVVLDDRSNPSINPTLPLDRVMQSYLFDKFPFTMTCSMNDNTTAWGAGDTEQLYQLNREFNKAISQMVYLKDKSARPKVVNPVSSGVPNSDFTNSPGIINPRNMAEAAAIRFMDFPNVPFDLEKMVGLLKEMFFLVSGSFDVDMAREGGHNDVLSYKSIAALMERAATMMRGKVRNYSKLLRERGRMYLSCLQNWYTEDRWFTWEENGNTVTDTINAEEAAIPVRLTVVNGSTLPVSKIQQREEALVLYEKGAIDQQDLLEKLDWSNRSEVLERMQKGQFGAFTSRMEAMGAPPELLQVVEQVASMDDKDFEKAQKDGQVPVLQWPGQENAGQQVAQNLETQKLTEELRRERAERQLVEEKASTERQKQEEIAAGIRYDKSKLKIERAQALSSLRSVQRKDAADGQAQVEDTTEDMTKNADRNKVRERGLKSNNRSDQ